MMHLELPRMPKGGLVRVKPNRPEMEIKVPATSGDIVAFGMDPYYSARSWHEAWMKSEARIARLERVREALEQECAEVGMYLAGSPHAEDHQVADALEAHVRAALAALDEK